MRFRATPDKAYNRISTTSIDPSLFRRHFDVVVLLNATLFGRRYSDVFHRRYNFKSKSLEATLFTVLTDDIILTLHDIVVVVSTQPLKLFPIDVVHHSKIVFPSFSLSGGRSRFLQTPRRGVLRQGGSCLCAC